MAEPVKAEIMKPGEPAAPQGIQQQSSTAVAYSVETITQFNTAIPSHVWTSEVLEDLHAKQHDISTRHIQSLNDQRIREHRLGIISLAAVSAIVAFGCYLVVIGNSLGSEILLATLTFLAGYLAGYGTGKTQRP